MTTELSSNSHPGVSATQQVAWQILDEILQDFGLDRESNASKIRFIGDVPNAKDTKSENINLSLIGTIPALINAIVAAQIFEARGGSPQTIEVDLRRGHNYIDPDIGMTPTINGQEIPLDVVAGNPFLGGIYETRDGRHVIPSAVYVDLVYQWSTFLRCAVNPIDVAAAIKQWDSQDLEAAAAETAGLPFAIVQSEDAWRSTPQGQHMTSLPIVPITRTGPTAPKPLPLHPRRPLEGVKVLCATHAIAGPSAGRTLAEHGATVLQIQPTHGFEHAFVYTSANLGTRSARLDFHRAGDRAQMWALIREADVWIDSYRDGALHRFGFTDAALRAANPALILSHVRLYGTAGPWVARPGFDMQGSASAGIMAFCGEGLAAPRWPPGQVINDYTTGYFGAIAIQAALLRRMREGGGYVLGPSLAKTAMTILKHFKTSRSDALVHATGEALPPEELEVRTGLGWLKTLKPLPVMDGTPIKYDPIVLEPMGSCLPVFGGDETYDVHGVEPILREKNLADWQRSGMERTRRLREAGDRKTAST